MLQNLRDGNLDPVAQPFTNDAFPRIDDKTKSLLSCGI
jgi:hypothetical protein